MKMILDKIKENKDGGATVTVDYDEEMKKFICKYYSRKRCTKNLVQKFIIEGLQNYLKKEKK